VTTPATTSQTVGPYFKIGLSPLYRSKLAGAATPGEPVTIQGRVLDGEGKPIPDAVLEIWQADAHGKYSARAEAEKGEVNADFSGFGRVPTDENGFFQFSTIKPGSVEGPNGSQQAPHIAVSIFMRGLLTRLVTRIYFAGDARNESDFVLSAVEKERRATLLAVPKVDKEGVMEWSIFLQGTNETVFFDF
jgi:protocatechuate 3,4-dioxygenase, alpha subunit